MALATQADVEDLLGRDLSEAEAARLPALLSDASALLIGFTGRDFEPAPYPEVVVGVVTRMVARMIESPVDPAMANVTQESETRGPFARSRTYADGATSGSVWLTTTDKMMLRAYRSGGLSSVKLVGERYTIAD